MALWLRGGNRRQLPASLHTHRYNQWVGGVREIKRGHHILCKSTAAMPFLNRPHKQRTWRSRLWARLFFFSRCVRAPL